MTRKHQVFVCSTFIDLQKQRQDIFAELYRHNFIPVGMEGFTPGSIGALAYIRDRIDESDYFVIVVAHRFGTVVPGSRIGESITEYEYGYALGKGDLPISRFVIDDKAPWSGSPDHRSHGEQADKLSAFKKRIAQAENDFFDVNPWDEGNLVQRVIASVNSMRAQVSRPGLIRPGAANEAAERFGVANLFPGLRDVDKKQILTGGEKLWIVLNDGYNFFESNSAHIVDVLRRGRPVRVLILHPETPCLEAVADKSHKSLERQAAEIHRTVTLLRERFSSFPNFELLGHRQFNTYAAMITERECLVDFYFNFRLASGRQDDRIALHCLHLDGSGSLHRKISDDFENFWRETSVIDGSNLLSSTTG